MSHFHRVLVPDDTSAPQLTAGSLRVQAHQRWQRPIYLQHLHEPHLSEARLIWGECGWGLWRSI